MQEMTGVCELLDSDDPHKPYTASLNKQTQAVQDPELTPSARMLDDMRQDHESFHRFAERMSRQHFHYYKNIELNPEQEQFYIGETEKSIKKQQQIEASDTQSFEEYLDEYFAQS